MALKSQRENALIDALYEVSNPKHTEHVSSNTPPRTHVLTCAVALLQIRQTPLQGLVAPHPNTVALVNSWLQYNSVPPSYISVTHGGNWLTLAGVPVSKANNLLGASYELYRHTKTNETTIRTLGYALPVVLHAHVRTVAPTTFFASPKTMRMTPVRAAAAKARAA